mmetsp:Transcript_40793/g.47452  ORF Transcript_40793/g.47452 Transcript_40793/m.47452 type:complete len:280 (+) Transcript_40793:66-905(+)|eukprot:CAMPEP_0176437014 /NCGR_PEP_ID=MMETSP0127-20121128/18354_1 /TAXON_ID=938130 /ORGANISM="Platyophrya macrostoma, Strain WH" /LENGTH=279 /DNA_ID=CAMNT_0017820529 /DNA_START=52 /DNA_END=891 /DNA_ORIENTATION=-
MGKFTKDKRDIYYRKAKEDGYRARSAYKLLQLDEEYDLFKKPESFVDLCCAPGSWSQVLSKKLTEKGFKPKDEQDIRAVSVDLQQIAPIEHIHAVQGDITKKETLDKVLAAFKGNKAQLVICDGAPDVTGFHDIDQYIQSQLLVAALNITTFLIEKSGVFVAKIFKGSDVKFLYSQFKTFFKRVDIVKPKSSRSASVEAFIVCLDFDPPADYRPKHFSTMDVINEEEEVKSISGDDKEVNPKSVQNFMKLKKFVTCGDLSGYDEDDTTTDDEEECKASK